MLISSGRDDLAHPSGNEVSKYPNSRLRRTIAPGAVPVTQRSSPSLSPSSSSPTPSPSSSPSPPQSPRCPPPAPVAQHPSRTANCWRRGGPLSPRAPQPISWAKKGAIGHLPKFLDDDLNREDSCLFPAIRKAGLRLDGFSGHPVLILSDPNKSGIVKFFPMTSWSGQAIEDKWSDMGPSKKAAKFGQFRQIAHPGVKSTLPELRLRDGGHLKKRTYLNMETCWEVEESILTKWGLGKDALLFLEGQSLESVINYAKRRWLL